MARSSDGTWPQAKLYGAWVKPLVRNIILFYLEDNQSTNLNLVLRIIFYITLTRQMAFCYLRDCMC